MRRWRADPQSWRVSDALRDTGIVLRPQPVRVRIQPSLDTIFERVLIVPCGFKSIDPRLPKPDHDSGYILMFALDRLGRSGDPIGQRTVARSLVDHPARKLIGKHREIVGYHQIDLAI